jgi:CO/xanthine dehydrogenase FAD-binding subunit
VVGAAVKPAPFAYEAPRSLGDALALVGEDSRPLAGGQSLVPMLNLRLARPERLVDLNRIESLAYLERSEGRLRIGALARQVALERSEVVKRRWPLLHQAVRTVGHAATRTRGTVAGSAAHADPAAELPVALVALDADFHLRSARGGRALRGSEFFLGPLTTALEPDELLVEISVPPMPVGARTAFVEHARTQGDFASAGAAVVLAPGEHAAVALLGAASRPVRAWEGERALVAGAGAAEAAALAVRSVRDDYRRALLGELVRRAIEETLG